MYELVARPLEFFYEIWPNYAGAIALLTLTIMLLLLPLTLKGTRSMLAMQKLQPELKKLQNKHRDDRQKLNEEVMKFYKENNINPMSGCLPLLLQMPVFFVLYRMLYELLNRGPYGQDMGSAVARSVSGVDGGVFESFGVFYPKHLSESSQLYQDLHSTSEMRSFGLNLAESAQKAFSDGIGHALPYIILVLAVTATSYYQQRQIAGRNTGAAVNPQQQMLMKIMPLFFAFISLTLPAGIVVYFLVSNTFRIGQQAFITHTMYRDDDKTISATATEVDDSSVKPQSFRERLKELAPNPTQARENARAASGSAGRADKSKAKAKASTTKGSKGKVTHVSPKGTKTKGADADKPGGGAAGKADAGSSATAKPAKGPSRQAPSQANRSRSKKKRK